MNNEDIVYRLEKRAEIRRSIETRKSVQEGKPDRISDLLEEAAQTIKSFRILVQEQKDYIEELKQRISSLEDFSYELEAGRDYN